MRATDIALEYKLQWKTITAIQGLDSGSRNTDSLGYKVSRNRYKRSRRGILTHCSGCDRFQVHMPETALSEASLVLSEDFEKEEGRDEGKYPWSIALTLTWCYGYTCVNLAGLWRLAVWANTNIDVSIRVF